MISHLFYADDAVFIGEWSNENLNGILNILSCFSLLSGMSINLKKIQILGMGIPESVVFVVAKDLGCSVMKAPFMYLGVMVGGGRLTLLKSVLGSSPIYNLSLFKVPKTVLNKMENLRRNCFNGNQEGDRKIAWVKWHTVLASKQYGGLGDQGVDVFSHCKIRIGNGVRTRFWKDCWIGESRLQGMFPRLYALESNKDICVADKLQDSLIYSFRRDVRGGAEAQQFNHLSTLLDPVILSNSKDRWVCDLSGDEEFRVKDVRNLLDEFFLSKADVPTRWVKVIPIKVNIFAWKMFINRLPTR
nr:RNA-directed DNA polymerase, eukaryota [Tanacetum cinerariifolium]